MIITGKMSWITSQNDTAPKPMPEVNPEGGVGLPVRTTLLQNDTYQLTTRWRLDYQSERHCSKTVVVLLLAEGALDYQSERHCSKTIPPRSESRCSWITSQNDTAPKQGECRRRPRRGWITSQNDTAPKLTGVVEQIDTVGLPVRTTLLQNVPVTVSTQAYVGLPVRTTLLQNAARQP